MTWNPGTELHLEWITTCSSDDASRWEAEAGPPDLGSPGEEAERLKEVVSLLDLTTLKDSDTNGSVAALCDLARHPLRPSPSNERATRDVQVAAVCVFDRFVPAAREALRGSGIRVAAVTAGFPEALPTRAARLREVRDAVASGADEIDAVITPALVLDGDWERLYGEVRDLRDACRPAHLKAILRAGLFGDLRLVYQAGLVCSMAGAHFIKTSTGLEEVNATLPMGRAMTAAIRTYAERSGNEVGFKPAGGIRTTEAALDWLRLVRRELGERWLGPDRFRIGASSLLVSIQDRVNALNADGACSCEEPPGPLPFT